MRFTQTRSVRRRGHSGGGLLLVLWLVGMTVLASPGLSAAARAGPGELWILVDTRSLTLSVMRGEAILVNYDNIAIGSNGATWNKRQGDEKTPLGEFRITEVRRSDRFVIFIAIDYPNLDHAKRALDEQRISMQTYTAVKNAFARGRPPPQETRLGGHIGIHGLGSGDPEIHHSFNWTNGCIALTNAQLAQLLPWIGPGTRVVIR